MGLRSVLHSLARFMGHRDPGRKGRDLEWEVGSAPWVRKWIDKRIEIGGFDYGEVFILKGRSYEYRVSYPNAHIGHDDRDAVLTQRRLRRRRQKRYKKKA